MKCGKCERSFSRSDYVMRARHQVFHTDCFRCVYCQRKLLPGDEFALKDNQLYCKEDHDLQHSGLHPLTLPPSSLDAPFANGAAAPSSGPPGALTPLGPAAAFSVSSSLTILASPMGGSSGLLPTPKDSPGGGGDDGGRSTSNSGGSVPPGGHSVASTSSSHPPHKKGKDKGKTTRVRTVLNEKQLHTLRTCYNANPRPDALMKEQLVEMTGLSPRVIRVWFQNKRCKDKKRQNFMKHMQQQHEKVRFC